MKRFLPSLVLLSCTAPPSFVPSEPVPPPAERPPLPVGGAEKLMAAIPQRSLLSAQALILPPLPATEFTSGQTRFTVEGHFAAQRTADDGWLFTVPNAGTARVTSISSEGGYGYLLNTPGNWSDTLLGRTLAGPIAVRPGDAIQIVSGGTGTLSPRPRLGYAAQMPTTVDEAVAIVFVSYDVDEARVGKLLRPPVWGRRGNPLVDFLRGFPWPVAWIDWSKLPSKPISGATPELLNFALQQHRYFSGDTYDGWNTMLMGISTPATAHQMYGTFVNGQMGQALLLCCSSLPLDSKKPLALALMQRAIDDLGGLCDGAWRYNLGGWCQGRRAPLVLLGHLLGVDVFADPTSVVGNRLPEDQFVTVTSFWGQPNWTGYLYSTSGTNSTDPNLWARHPSTWTGDRNSAGSGERWAVMYGEQVFPSHTAAATAIVLMGREHSAPKLVNAVRCWVKGPPQAALDALFAAGCDLHFGINYATEIDAVLAWKQFAQ